MAKLRLLAHRGYAARFPENTREALSAAIAAGARQVEFDIQLSKDQVPHLLHDADFQRTAGDPRTIFELTAEEVARLYVSERQRLGDEFSRVQAPPLADVVADLAATPDVQAFVEIKHESVEHFGVDAVLEAVLPTLEPIARQVVVISFEREVLEGTRMRTDWPLGWALRQWDGEHEAWARAFDPEYLFCNVLRLPEPPAPLWEGGWTWVIYEITDAAVALELASRGVGMVETMQLPELRTDLDALLKADCLL